MIDLSIVVPSYDTRDLLAACLDSIEAACRAHPDLRVETIVVDNASMDGSPDLVIESHPRVRLLASIRNRGFSAAVNLGLRVRRGRHVMLLNSDVEIDPDLIAEGLELLARHPTIGVLGLALFHADGRPQRSAHRAPGVLSEWVPGFLLGERGTRERGSRRSDGVAACSPIEAEAVRGAGMLIRGELLERIGGFDEGFFFFLEDTEFCVRARRAGWAVALAPSLRAVHHLGASSKRRAPLATRIQYHRSLYRYLSIESGRSVAWMARAVRTARGLVLVSMLGLAAPFSGRARRQLPERWGLLMWHLRACPADPRLDATLEAKRAPRAGQQLVAATRDVRTT